MATTASSSINPLLYIVTILWIRHRRLVFITIADGQSPLRCNDHQRRKGGWNAQSPYQQHHLRHHDARLPRDTELGFMTP